MGKSELFSHFADRFEVKRTQAREFFDELTTLSDIVLATGGGAILSEDNRAKLRCRGTVVYLRATVRDLLNRTRHDRNRPLLQTADPRARLTELYELRDPLYREAAHVIIETGSQSLTSLVARLHQMLLEVPSRSLEQG